MPVLQMWKLKTHHLSRVSVLKVRHRVNTAAQTQKQNCSTRRAPRCSSKVLVSWHNTCHLVTCCLNARDASIFTWRSSDMVSPHLALLHICQTTTSVYTDKPYNMNATTLAKGESTHHHVITDLELALRDRKYGAQPTTLNNDVPHQLFRRGVA